MQYAASIYRCFIITLPCILSSLYANTMCYSHKGFLDYSFVFYVFCNCLGAYFDYLVLDLPHKNQKIRIRITLVFLVIYVKSQ